MPSIAELRTEHRDILAAADRFQAAISQPVPPAPIELFHLRRELIGLVVRHTRKEDWLLYPRLLKGSAGPAAREIAERLQAEAAVVTARFDEWSRDWTSAAIAADWPGFRAETRAILGALRERVRIEETRLFPAAEPDLKRAG